MTSTPGSQQDSVGGQRSGVHRPRHRHHRPHHHHRNLSQQQGTKHLDFNQAMSDFKLMFPTMDSDVIEAVLRANDGVVDATIDQLLTMNVDLGGSEVSDKPKDPPPRSVDLGVVPSPASLSSGPPPPYQARLADISSSSSSDDDMADPFTQSLRNMRIREQTVPKVPLSNQPVLPPPKVYRHWNPPLIGKLPDDFLRLTVPASVSRHVSRQGSNLQTVMSTTSKTPVAAISPKPALRTTISASSEGKNSSVHEINRNRKMLKEKMAENAKQRREVPNHFDAETARYLEDERLALMLQNQEFLDELKRNAEFMNTLEKDVRNEKDIALLPHDAAGKPDDIPEHEGYGDDNLEELGAFPHTKTTQQQSDAEFKSQLSNMGVSSKKKFAILASKFFSRRRRSKKTMPRQLLKESTAPSMMNLLDDNDDEDLEDDRQQRRMSADEKPVIEPLPGSLASVPRTKTVQRSSFHAEPIVFYQDDDNFNDMV